MPALLVDAPTARSLLSMPACIDVVEGAFEALAAGAARVPLRTRIDLPELGGSGFFMPAAAVGPEPGLGSKIVTVFDGNRRRGLPSVLSLYVLLDPETGLPACVMDGRYLTNLRTGAATGVAVRHLAPEGPLAAGIVGLGVQALYQLLAASSVRELSRVRAYSPSGPERREWAERIAGAIGTEVEIRGSATEAVRGAELVILATSHPGPVVDGEVLADGATVCAIGMHASEPWRGELDPAMFRRAHRVVCDSVDAALRESGDVIAAVEEGLVRREELVELADVVTGGAAGREGRGETVLFRSVGLAVEDLAAARAIHRRAVEAGAGETFAFDDFREPA